MRSPRSWLARRLARRPRALRLAHAVPGLRGPVGSLAEAEYREAAAAERAARGIVLPSDRPANACVWCGALALPVAPSGGIVVPAGARVDHDPADDVVWVVDMSMPVQDCPGHELLGPLPKPCADYQLDCGHRGRDWAGFPGDGPERGVIVTCGACRRQRIVVWVDEP